MKIVSSLACAVVLAAGRCLPTGAQVPTVRDSGGVRIVENDAPAPGTRHWRVVDSSPVLTLGGPGAKGNADLGDVVGALLLPDDGLVVAEFDRWRVAYFDAHGGYRFGIDVVGVSGRREGPRNLFPMAGGVIAEWDGVANRVMELNGKGTTLRVRHVDNPPDVRSRLPRGGWSRPLLSLQGAFASGEMLGTTHNQLLPGNRQTDTDTLVIYRVDRRGKVTSLGSFFGSERFGFAGRYSVAGQIPLGRNASIAVDDDSWYYTDGSTFEVQRRDPIGHLDGLIRIARRRPMATPAVVRHVKMARLERSDPVLRRDDSLALEWISFPSREPAYTALEVDDTHRLWARIWSPDGDPATWDVFDQSGRLLGTVVVPPDLDVLQIADDHLLARYTFHPDISELRLFRLTSTP